MNNIYIDPHQKRHTSYNNNNHTSYNNNNLNKVSLKKLYYAHIYPYFTYCIEVWGSAAKCHVNFLFLLQKKIIRIMTYYPYLAQTAPIFIDLAILPSNKIFIDRICILCSK